MQGWLGDALLGEIGGVRGKQKGGADGVMEMGGQGRARGWDCMGGV